MIPAIVPPAAVMNPEILELMVIYNKEDINNNANPMIP
jgi:hypothetical protein